MQKEMQNSKYINEKGNEVPSNNIIIVPGYGKEHEFVKNKKYKDIIEDFRSNPKRDWFPQHFYHCLPIVIGNQYGFGIKSLYNFKALWNGGSGTEDVQIEIEDYVDSHTAQKISSHFGSGIITLSHYFYLRTQPGMNLMVLPAANHFVPNLSSMTAVIETDNIRRDFTFNLKILEPNKEIIVKKGDVLTSFLPIPRYFIDNFKFLQIDEVFSLSTIQKEGYEVNELGRQRSEEEPHEPPYGKKYFRGIHANGEKFNDHQTKVKKP